MSEREATTIRERESHPIDFDVVIVGYGPVGQAAAALLGQRGHRVAAFERYGELYALPRAVHFDDEVMRVWQAIGIGEEIAEDLQPMSTYDWFGADGEPIVQLRAPSPGPSGWSPSYSVYQPNLERALDRAVRALPNVEVHRGWSAERLLQRSDRVQLGLRAVGEDELGVVQPGTAMRSVSARYVLAADGANSFVREALGIEFEDLGFAERWLVADVRPHDMDALADLPIAAQWCDPERPHMHIQNGRRHRRFEFMLLPGERAEDFDETRVWRLLEPHFRPRDGAIVRSTVYEFRGRLARHMSRGRVLLAGDAAKTTPPFMGQGLCGGIRDVINAAWRLDLLLRGLAGEHLLEGYCAERRTQNESIIRLSIEMGRVSCVLDREAAEERDRALRAAPAPVSVGLRRIEGGLQAHDRPLAGTLSVQGRVAAGGREGLFDDVGGRGFVLLAAHGDPREHLSAKQLAHLQAIDATIASLDELQDRDGRLTAWLAGHGVHALLIRPDFYVFGGAASPAELPALVEDLRSQLRTPEPEERPMSASAAVIKPKFHHVNLKTTRLQEMIEWYAALVGVEVIHRDELGAWLSNDEANHRIALLAFASFLDDPDKEKHTGMHHSAFEYASFDELNDSYMRLHEAGIDPTLCLDHGMTFSYYYLDPDGNNVELQVDNFGDWARSKEWMRNSQEFRRNPIGAPVDPQRVAAERAAGMSFEEIHRKAMAGGYAPAHVPDELAQASGQGSS